MLPAGRKTEFELHNLFRVFAALGVTQETPRLPGGCFNPERAKVAAGEH
jgi:hypothetical protein